MALAFYNNVTTSKQIRESKSFKKEQKFRKFVTVLKLVCSFKLSRIQLLFPAIYQMRIHNKKLLSFMWKDYVAFGSCKCIILIANNL